MHENRETSGAPRPRKGMRPVREGPKPHGGHARSGGVGPRHTIDEPDEQGRKNYARNRSRTEKKGLGTRDGSIAALGFHKVSRAAAALRDKEERSSAEPGEKRVRAK